jgi:hypothetical protein
MKNHFDDRLPINMPGNSFSSSLLNESFDHLKHFNHNKTLDDDFSCNTRNLLISAPYWESKHKHVDLSDTSLSPQLGNNMKQSDGHLQIKSPLYTLNSSKTRTEKYKSHLFNWYRNNIERSNSANPAITEREV